MIDSEMDGPHVTPGSLWVAEVFKNDEVSRRIPPKILSQAWQIMGSCLDSTTDADAIVNMKRKIVHSRDAVRATFDIATLIPEIEWNIPQALTIGLLHDIGRLPQANLGRLSDFHTSFNHAEAGAKIVEELDFSDTGIDINVVTSAIKRHNLVEAGTEDPYALLVRDADKLALLRAAASQPRLQADENEAFAPISPKVREAFLAGGFILNRFVETLSDDTVKMLAWVTGFAYPVARKLVKDEKLVESVGELLGTLTGGLDSEVQSRIRELV